MSDQSSGGSPAGPSITYHTKEQQQMATQLAGKTEWVDAGDGIRRLVVEGAPIPPGVGLEDQRTGDDVDPRTLTQPVVDEEASKSFADRTGTTFPEAGTSTENVEAVGGGRKRASSSAKTGSTGSGA
jgi:hypothetical protein